MDKNEFMRFFRSDECLETLTPDDRTEIFLSILSGSSDVTVELLRELCASYDVTNIIIKPKKQPTKQQLYNIILSRLTDAQRQQVVDRALELLPEDFELGYSRLNYADIVADLFFNDGAGNYKSFDELTLEEVQTKFKSIL